jgi:hypothetical protein
MQLSEKTIATIARLLEIEERSRDEYNLGDFTDAEDLAKKHYERMALTAAVRELHVLTVAQAAEIERLRFDLNWQNHRNSGRPTRGGYEFYINEEWRGIASAELDTVEANGGATLMKHRFDPDDERVRVRLVIEDDQILKELAEQAERIAALEAALVGGISTLSLSERPRQPDPLYHKEVKALGRRIGFGAMMSTAEAGWREVLEERGDFVGGEHTVGACRATLDDTLKVMRAALLRDSHDHA